jgi:hypothetical protein
VLELAKAFSAMPQKVSCDNPEIIVRTRKFGDATYVFVVNDHREYGSYVGQHELVMENGLPSKGIVSLKAESANVYELTGTGFIVPKRGEDGVMSWPVELGPCDGKIFMVTPKPLLGIQLEVPELATVGNAAKIMAKITTTQDTPTKAVIPVRVDVRDANGKLTEGSGFYAAENGIAELSLNLAPNEDPGTWEIRVKELASGMEAIRWMRVGMDQARAPPPPPRCAIGCLERSAESTRMSASGRRRSCRGKGTEKSSPKRSSAHRIKGERAATAFFGCSPSTCSLRSPSSGAGPQNAAKHK